jgi:uroporphyrinogen-III synthase
MSCAIDHQLQGCHVVSLRPSGQHAALRRAAAARGARVIALSPWRIVHDASNTARSALQAALKAPYVVFTSPSAVRAASTLVALRARRDQRWLAVGEGTARALDAAGIASAIAPSRMDSSGLLALPELDALRGTEVGLVTAPGGRDALLQGLQGRGAHVLRADIYERQPIQPARAAVARLMATTGCLWLALSSGEALRRTLEVLPSQASRQLREARVSAASKRLAALAVAEGFSEAVVAQGPRPAALIAAMGWACRK